MRTHKKARLALGLILLLILSVTVFFVVRGTAVIKRTCRADINAKINDIINVSNDKVINLDVFYADYFTIIYDENNDIAAIKANTGLINQITLIWNTEIQNGLNKLRNTKIVMPFGALTGSSLLAKYGMDISIDAQVISNCAITYASHFTQAGINQTLHRFVLYTEIVAEIIVPSGVENVIVSQEIVLAETIINGKVPQSYLIGDGSLDYLDLIP